MPPIQRYPLCARQWRRMPLKVPGIYPSDRVQDFVMGRAPYLRGTTPCHLQRSTNSALEPRIIAISTRPMSWNDLLQQWGIIGVPTTGVKTGPNFNINGVTPWSPDAQSDNFQDNPQTTLQWIDNLSWTRGRHFMKFGFDAVRDRFNGNNINALVYGQYRFQRRIHRRRLRRFPAWHSADHDACPFRIPIVT